MLESCLLQPCFHVAGCRTQAKQKSPAHEIPQAHDHDGSTIISSVDISIDSIVSSIIVNRISIIFSI